MCTGVEIGLIASSVASAAAAGTSAGVSASQQHQQRKAQKTAERRASEERRAAQAATPGTATVRDGSTGSTNEHLRGIQSTMLASRQAQNFGNTTLGA